MIIQVPEFKNYPQVKGSFVGGCVERGEGSRFRAKAHTHFEGEYKGWICILSIKRLMDKPLLLHELAHAITNGGHTDKWRETLIAIGGTIDKVPGLLRSYRKRKRKRGGKN